MMLLGLAGPVNLPAGSVRVGTFPQLVSVRYTSADGLTNPITGIACSGDRIYVRTAAGAMTLDGSRWRAVRPGEAYPEPTAKPPTALPGGRAVLSAARTRSGEWWAVASDGAFRLANGKWTPLGLPKRYVAHQPMPNIDLEIHQIMPDPSGHVWLATTFGACLTDGADWWQPLDRSDGMPYEVLNCLASAPNGDLWGGTDEGAWRLRNGEFRYFWGKRWLPGNRVSGIAVDTRSRAWIATDNGVAMIEERPMTLPEKAAHLEQITGARHSRSGWIAGCQLKVPGKPEEGFTHHASDNDGLWTAIYVAAEAFRYSATKDPAAAESGRKSMNALLDLVRLSGYEGFPARAIIRKGENVTGYDPDETVRVPGETDKIWYESPTHPGVLCKGDTSSDELDGHYFAWYVYHELAATADEKKEIARICRAVTDNLLKHDFTLVGHTGRKTRWGVFGPQYLNLDPAWVEERGLNSLELLCYLKVAHHICGDKRFADAYEMLIRDHHYLINTLLYRRDTPRWRVNFSDDELAYCVYYPLLMLEKAPDRRAILLRSLSETWAGLRDEDRAWYNVTCAALTGEPARIERAVACLQDWAWEQVNWGVKNSHRHDVTLSISPLGGRALMDRVLPWSEQRVMRWNGNPFAPDSGGDGGSEEDAGGWLLAYWMGRHHNLITH